MAASRLITGFAIFVALCSPVLAEKTCVIVYSTGTNGDWAEKYWHEMAHCNGWSHPAKGSMFGAAYKPPKRYLFVYPGPISSPCGESACTVRQAKRLCDGHFGCQWFEIVGKVINAASPHPCD
jgi:hypothetical protein